MLLRALSCPARLCRTLLLALGLSSVGCAGGGQTGGEIEVDSPCDEQATPVSLDDSSLGFSAVDILSFSAGSHQAALIWSTDTAPATYGPEQGSGALSLRVEPIGTDARILSPKLTPNMQTGAELVFGCPPERLAMDVEVTLTSAGGALSETFTTTLWASSATRAQFSKPLHVQALAGSFYVTVPEGHSAVTLYSEASFEPQGVEGSLWGQVEQRSGTASNGTVSAQMVVYARWSSDFPTVE